MSPDTMTSTQGDSQDMNNMDTSEPSLPLDDASSSAEDKIRRRNPFVQSDDEEEAFLNAADRGSMLLTSCELWYEDYCSQQNWNSHTNDIKKFVHSNIRRSTYANAYHL